MASSGIQKRISKRTGRVSYEVWWLLDDGAQGSTTVATRVEARDLLTTKRVEIMRGMLGGHQRGRLPFGQWADEWWALWSSEPGRSPATLQTTESQLRTHVRPFFERHQVRAITPTLVRKWQNQLRAKPLGNSSVMACRSILRRILQLAEDEGAIALNPLRKVPTPRWPVDPEDVFDDATRHAPTPKEAGLLLAHIPDHWRDHVVVLLGTGLRIGELAGLRRRRVLLKRGVLQVADVRYQAGKFGRGFKNRPKSEAGIREVPLARQVAEAIRRQLPPGEDPDALVFTGPGGGPGQRDGPSVPRGARTVLNRDNFRRMLKAAVANAADPAAGLPPTAKRVLAALRADGPATVADLTTRLAAGGRALHPASVAAALARVKAAGLAVRAGGDPAHWAAAQVPRSSALDALDLRGPHDLRHSFATWMEEEGIPARVIDELMGHADARRDRSERGSRIGRGYRETSPEMRARVVAAIERRLDAVLEAAEAHRPPRRTAHGAAHGA
jgi:integrase